MASLSRSSSDRIPSRLRTTPPLDETSRKSESFQSEGRDGCRKNVLPCRTSKMGLEMGMSSARSRRDRVEALGNNALAADVSMYGS